MLPEVSHFIEGATQWQEEMNLLRRILLECKLEEAYKWSVENM